MGNTAEAEVTTVATTLPPKPFSDISAQKSKVALAIIEKVKQPMLRIYEIGIRTDCSHFKHFVRLDEYVLLTEPGVELYYDFDPAKIEKTKNNFKSGKVSKEEKAEVRKLCNEMLTSLRELSGLPAEKAEQFMYSFVYELIENFAGGGNVLAFHTNKINLFKAYNIFVLDSKKITIPKSKKVINELLKKAGVPIVGNN